MSLAIRKQFLGSKYYLETAIKRPTYFGNVNVSARIRNVSILLPFYREQHYASNAEMKVYAGIYLCYQCRVSTCFSKVFCAQLHSD